MVIAVLGFLHANLDFLKSLFEGRKFRNSLKKPLKCIFTIKTINPSSDVVDGSLLLKL